MTSYIWILFSGPFRNSSWCPGSHPGLRTNIRTPFHNSSATISTSNFKCVTLRFENYADMVEYSLRPITNSGIWRSIMAPTYSTMTLVIEWTIHIYYQFPLSRDILLVRGLIFGITLYLVQPRLLTSTLYSYRGMWCLMNSFICLQDIRRHSTERAQSISIRHRDGQIPLLIHMPQLILFGYLIPSL